MQPTSQESLRLFNPGNLANWNVGLDEYGPWKDSGLNGVYTLRLRAIGTDGREAVDSVPVIVGRLAHLAEGGTIVSPDGTAQAHRPAAGGARSVRADGRRAGSRDVDPVAPWRDEACPQACAFAGEVYEVLPPDETFRRSGHAGAALRREPASR